MGSHVIKGSFHNNQQVFEWSISGRYKKFAMVDDSEVWFQMCHKSPSSHYFISVGSEDEIPSYIYL